MIFEPQALADTMQEMLDETGRCRTMMQLGEAAGIAAHTAIDKGIPLREVHPVQALPRRRFGSIGGIDVLDAPEMKL